MTKFDDTKTVKEAKQFLKDHLETGVNCPCCGQHVKLYPRALNSGLARALILMHRAPTTPEGWVDIKNVDVRGGDYAKLRYWELIEQRSSGSGVWRVTLKGVKFVSDQGRVPKTVFVYNGRVRAFSDDTINIRQALGKAFSYEELMR